jgi:hypothetical protein
MRMRDETKGTLDEDFERNEEGNASRGKMVEKGGECKGERGDVKKERKGKMNGEEGNRERREMARRRMRERKGGKANGWGRGGAGWCKNL